LETKNKNCVIGPFETLPIQELVKQEPNIALRQACPFAKASADRQDARKILQNNRVSSRGDYRGFMGARELTYHGIIAVI